jgi:small subunit ribosomal protein S4e
MVKNHIKRINAPKRWDILRKDNKFITKPNPGRKLDMAVSINTALKEMLTVSSSTKETKYLIKHKGIMVNGVRRYDDKFPVGLFDVLSIAGQQHYRLIVNSQNKLEFVHITEAESKLKISKVENKRMIAGGKIQVTCTDGRTFLFDKAGADKIMINDTVEYAVPGQEVKNTFNLNKGALVLLYKGKHIGNIVKVNDFKGSNITFDLDGETLETKKSYAFVVGKDKAVVTVTERRETPKAK